MSQETPHKNTAANGASRPEGVVASAVELAYAVSEEHIKMARRVAEQVSEGKMDSEQISGNLSEVLERLRHFYSDLGALWFETLESVFRNQSFGDWMTKVSADASDRFDEFSGEYTPKGSPAPQAAAQHAAIPVEIVSAEATGAQVKIKLHQEIGFGELVIMPLCSRDSTVAPLTQATFVKAREDWPLTAQIHIPPGQAAGTYSGLIINTTTDEPWGTVCVQIPARNSTPEG